MEAMGRPRCGDHRGRPAGRLQQLKLQLQQRPEQQFPDRQHFGRQHRVLGRGDRPGDGHPARGDDDQLPGPDRERLRRVRAQGQDRHYIPLVQQIPGFVVTAATMKTALAKVGLNLQVCNGEAQPSAIAACVTQATGAHAAGIVLDSIPYGMAENALMAAKAKGVPVIVADQYPPAGNVNTDSVTYVPGVVNQPTQIAYWMIADSQGKANAIIAEEADSQSSIQYVVNSEAIYKQLCPDCTVAVKQITEATNTLIASATSSNLLAHPEANYYYTEFEDSLQPTIQGIQQSNKTDISLSVAGASTDSLGLLKSGSLVQAAVAVDQAYA